MAYSPRLGTWGAVDYTPGGKQQATERVVELPISYKTLADLCSSPPPAIEGRSIAPLLRNPKATWNYPSFAVVQFQGKLGESVRTERWHYVEWAGGSAGSMLLDALNDPLELRNLSAEPGQAATVQEMKSLLKQLPAK